MKASLLLYSCLLLWLSILPMEEKSLKKLKHHKYTESSIRRATSNLQNAHEYEKLTEFVCNLPSFTSLKKQYFQFRLAFNLKASFEKYNTLAAIDGDCIDAESSNVLKIKVANLGSTYFFNAGIHYQKKAHIRFPLRQEHIEDSPEHIESLQKAIHYAKKSEESFQQSRAINNSPEIEAYIQNINETIQEIEKKLTMLPSYKKAVEETKEAFSFQENANVHWKSAQKLSTNAPLSTIQKVKTRRKKKHSTPIQHSQYPHHWQDSRYWEELDQSEDYFIQAAKGYLNVAESILDNALLNSAQRNLEGIYKIQRERTAAQRPYIVKKDVTMISNKLEELFDRIQIRDETSSSPTASDGSTITELREKENKEHDKP